MTEAPEPEVSFVVEAFVKGKVHLAEFGMWRKMDQEVLRVLGCFCAYRA